MRRRLLRWFGRAQRPVAWSVLAGGFVSLMLVITNVIATGDAKFATILGALVLMGEGFSSVQEVENELDSEAAAEPDEQRGDALMSAQDVADLCGVPLGTVYAWNSRGTGPSRIAVGKHVRYRPEDVQAWLDGRS